MTRRAWGMFNMFCATVTTASATDSGLCGEAKVIFSVIDDDKVWMYVRHVVREFIRWQHTRASLSDKMELDRLVHPAAYR